MVDMCQLLSLLIDCRDALRNVPEVGDIYDQQHADTQMEAIIAIDDFLTRAGVTESG